MREEEVRDALGDGANAEAAARAIGCYRAAVECAEDLREVVDRWSRTSMECQAGRQAEVLHKGTFNIDAAAKGLGNVRADLQPHGTSADLSISRAGRVVDQAQLKFNGTPARTTFEAAHSKYDGMQRVAPSDQLQRIRELASKRSIGGLVTRNYSALAKEASDRVRFASAESQPLSREAALNAARDPQRVAVALISETVVSAMARAATTGAVIGAASAGVSNLVAAAEGRKSVGDAIADSMASAASAGANGAAVSVTAIAAETALMRAGMTSLATGSAPVALALTAVDMGKDVVKLVSGGLDVNDFSDRVGRHAIKGGCTYGGMEAGAAIGTALLPGVGTIVGGIVGGLAGRLFGGWLLD